MTVDLSTRYLGLELANPIVPSASPLGRDLETLRQLEEAGAAAVVLPSLFEEQIEHDSVETQRLASFESESFGEATFGYFPELDEYRTGPEEYLQHVADAKTLLSIPVIPSLNGTSSGGWTRYAKLLEEAGADALELNVYLLATDVVATSAEIEQQYLDLVASARETVDIPLAVKIGPYFSSLGHMAWRLREAGADGLVLFNRFYQPDIDLERFGVSPTVELSTAAELRLPLRWIAILRGRVEVSLAATTGIHTASDVLKALLVGADVAMMASALLEFGPRHVRTVLEELEAWLVENEYESVEQLKGSMSHEHSPDPAAFERTNYMRVLASWRPPA